MPTLVAKVEIHASAERCFDLARSVDVHQAGSEVIDGRAVGGRTSGLSELGDETTWSARFFGVRFRLTNKIVEFRRPDGFSEVMCRGLFRRFGHRYTFETLGPGQTLMTDELTFESPLGVVGRCFDAWVLRFRMQRLLEHRVAYLKRVAEEGGRDA